MNESESVLSRQLKNKSHGSITRTRKVRWLTYQWSRMIIDTYH